jgi:hypothetical protein
MAFEKIISISGQSGLFQVISQTKFGLIAESLDDGKRIPVYSNLKVSSLAEICIYAEEGEIPLNEVLLKLMEIRGGESVEFKNDAEAKAIFESALPTYDKEKVYVSDMKKVLKWYNTLLKKDLIKAEEDTAESTAAESKDTSEEKQASKKTATKKAGGANEKKAVSGKSAAPKAASKSKGASKVSAPRKAQ